MTAGRALPPPSAFGGDDGSTPPPLQAAFGIAEAVQRLEAVVAALPQVRLLVPVVARLDELNEPGEHGIAGEKSAHTAMVTVAVPDGRAALPVFSSVAAMTAWRPDARPVPVDGRRAALAAGAEADSLLVLDPGSPQVVQIPRPAVRAIALGEPWVPAYRNPAVVDEVRRVLLPLPQVQNVSVKPGSEREIVVIVKLWRHPAGDPDPETAAAMRACGQALSSSQVFTDLVDSLYLRPAITH